MPEEDPGTLPIKDGSLFDNSLGPSVTNCCHR